MRKVLEVEYDAAANVLRLAEPLEGVAHGARLQVTLTPINDPVDRPWLAFRGCLSAEDGDEIAAIIEEQFPTEK